MRRARVDHIAVAMAALAALVAGCDGGSVADRADRSLLTVEQEIQVGRATAPYFEKLAGGRLQTPPVQAYVRTVGERVARAAPRRELPYQFAVLDSPDVRTFALPGGSVYVTRGLLAILATESQLAAALAHEWAHTSVRDLAPALGRNHGSRLLLDAADAAVPGPAVRRRDETLGRLAKAIHDHAYTLETEAAADRLGLDYLVAAGYNPSGMVAFLETLARNAAPGPSADPAGRAGRLRKIVERKYRDAGGRVADEEYRGEVLDRLTAR